jgi:hypothetical protein
MLPHFYRIGSPRVHHITSIIVSSPPRICKESPRRGRCGHSSDNRKLAEFLNHFWWHCQDKHCGDSAFLPAFFWYAFFAVRRRRRAWAVAFFNTSPPAGSDDFGRLPVARARHREEPDEIGFCNGPACSSDHGCVLRCGHLGSPSGWR